MLVVQRSNKFTSLEPFLREQKSPGINFPAAARYYLPGQPDNFLTGRSDPPGTAPCTTSWLRAGKRQSDQGDKRKRPLPRNNARWSSEPETKLRDGKRRKRPLHVVTITVGICVL